MKLGTALHATYRTAVLMTTVAVNKFTGNTQRAAAAQRLLNAAQKANIYALLISLVVGLVAALVSYSKSIKQVSFAEQTLSDIKQDAQKNLVEEKNKIEALVRVAEDETASLDARKRRLML
jgi:hypothetical protein